MAWSTAAIRSRAMEISRTDSPDADWDAFVERTPGARLGHAAAWAGILRRAYGLAPLYLSARNTTGEIEGVLPLIRFRTLSGRRELISIPFHDAAGVLARGCEAGEALLQAAFEEVRKEAFSALELRQVEALKGFAPSEFAEPRVGLMLPLESSESAQWKAIGPKVRNQTRKASREGLTLSTGSPASLLDAFYRPFSINMRDLGSPVHSKRFFAETAKAFGDRLRFVVASDTDRAVGGLVAIRFAGKVTVPWASTLRSERRRCPNNLIYWDALRWAVDQGCEHFDFGRSPVGAGTYKFKRGWGAEEQGLAWTRLGPGGEPLEIASPGQNVWLSKFSALWARLPVAATRSLGSRMRRYISS